MSWRDILKAKKNKKIKELVERWDALQNDRFGLLYFTGSQKKAIREYKNKQAIKERNEEYNKNRKKNEIKTPSKAERRKLQHSKGKERLQ